MAKTAKTAGLNFKTTLLTAKKTATGIEVPPTIVDALGQGKKPPVKITINGYTYRSTVAVMGGKYMIGVSAEVREKANVAGGDKVDITLELDTAPREVEVPDALQKALNKNPAAKKKFEGLSPSGKKRFTLPIGLAKTDETRDRNVAKALAELQKK
jgi:hypothetical protein